MEQLQRGEKIETILGFGEGQWSARIVPGSGRRIAFLGGGLTLELSAENLAALADSANEGIYFHQAQMPYRYFVEKDYPCIHPRGGETLEPVTEAFAPPDGFEARKLSA